MVVEPDLDMEHPEYAGSGKFYDIHVCDEDAWTFQFEFEYEEDDQWIEGGSFDIEAIAVSPQGDKVWMFEKKQHWEKKVWSWPRVFESENIKDALKYAGKDRFIQIKVREITKFPRPCEEAPEAWEWLSKPENLFFGRSIIENEKIATNVYKYKKLHEYGHREGLVDMFLNGTDCTEFPPIFWMITGANLHPSGKRLAIQTYSGAFEYVFSEPMKFEELATLKPRQLGLPRFDQVESIVYSHDGKSLYAIPEALGRKGWQKVEQIKCKAKPKVEIEENQSTDSAEQIIEQDPSFEGKNGSSSTIAIRSIGKHTPDKNSTVVKKRGKDMSSFLNDALDQIMTPSSSQGDNVTSVVKGNTTENDASVEEPHDVDLIVLDPNVDYLLRQMTKITSGGGQRSHSDTTTTLEEGTAHANAHMTVMPSSSKVVSEHSDDDDEKEDRDKMVNSFLNRIVVTSSEMQEKQQVENLEEEPSTSPQVRMIGDPGRILGTTLILELEQSNNN